MDALRWVRLLPSPGKHTPHTGATLCPGVGSDFTLTAVDPSVAEWLHLPANTSDNGGHVEGHGGSADGRSAGATRRPGTVIVADDDPLARRALRDSLQGAGMTVVAEAGTGREAIDLTLHYHPLALLLDLDLHDLHAIDVTRRVRWGGGEDVAVIVLASSHDDETAVSVLRPAPPVGSKSTPLDSIPRAVRGAVDGEAAVSRRLLRTLIEELGSTQAEELGLRPVHSPLSPREWEVLDMFCHGASVDDIATRLDIVAETVRSHLKRIRRKTGARGPEELLRRRTPAAPRAA